MKIRKKYFIPLLLIFYSSFFISASRHPLITKQYFHNTKICDTTRDSLNKTYRYAQPGMVIDVAKPKGFINDFGKIFTKEQVDTLTKIVKKREEETSDQICVVTFNSLNLSKEEFDVFTLGLANNWSIGQKDKNNGILIAICLNIHAIRIQNGYGIEKKLSNSETKEIIDSIIIPEFKNGNFYEGTKKGVLAIIKKIT